jgi:hypothetical protein
MNNYFLNIPPDNVDNPATNIGTEVRGKIEWTKEEVSAWLGREECAE